LREAREVGHDGADVESEGPHPLLHELLGRLLLAEEAGDPNELGKKLDRVVERALDCAARVR
jgi:hypothetical protein